MGGPNLGGTLGCHRRSAEELGKAVSLAAKFHLMRDLTVGCGFRAVGKIEYSAATKSGKLLSGVFLLPLRPPTETYVCG